MIWYVALLAGWKKVTIMKNNKQINLPNNQMQKLLNGLNVQIKDKQMVLTLNIHCIKLNEIQSMVSIAYGRNRYNRYFEKLLMIEQNHEPHKKCTETIPKYVGYNSIKKHFALRTAGTNKCRNYNDISYSMLNSWITHYKQNVNINNTNGKQIIYEL